VIFTHELSLENTSVNSWELTDWMEVIGQTGGRPRSRYLSAIDGKAERCISTQCGTIDPTLLAFSVFWFFLSGLLRSLGLS